MAHHAEPMDVDCMDSEFDNKENASHRGNVPCTEKGYEELDVSELNMKLRLSMTPSSSPMSKSFTACPNNRYLEADNVLSGSAENANLTRSLNSNITKSENVTKPFKSLPLQALHTEQYADVNDNSSVFRQLDSTLSHDANITVTITGSHDVEDNISLPSSSSSVLNTPEAITPTKEVKDGGSPIMRGLKSVLNMFRTSQSPVPHMEGDNMNTKQEGTSLTDTLASENSKPHIVASTPIAANRSRDSNSSKRSSPHKNSIVFNDDLEKELNWRDDTFVSGMEKTPINKMLLQNSKSLPGNHLTAEINLNNTTEFMDVSNNDTVIEDKTMTELQPEAKLHVNATAESDSEFLDCETTISRNESYVLDVKAVQEQLAANDTTFSKNDSYILDIKSVQEKLFQYNQNPDKSRNISTTTKNSLKHQSDVTNITFTDIDFKHDGDITVPSDYSDYSKCTSEILTELDKIKANISSEVDVIKNETVIEQKDTTEEQVASKIVTSEAISLEENSQALESPEIESQPMQNKEIKIFDKEALTTPTEESQLDIEPNTISNTNEIILDTEQHNITLNQISKDPQGQMPEVSPVEDSEGECNSKVDLALQNFCENQLSPDTNIVIMDSTKTENQSVEIVSEISTDTPVACFNNRVELTEPSESCNILTHVVNSIENLNKFSNEIVSSPQNVAVPSVDASYTQNAPQSLVIPCIDLPLPEKVDPLYIAKTNELATVSEKPSDMSLPDDDDVERDLSDKVLASMSETAPSPQMLDMTVNLSESKVIEIVPERINNTEKKYRASNDSLLTTETLLPHLFELKHIQNVDNKSCDEKSLNPLPNSKIDEGAVLPELCNISLESSPYLISEFPLNENNKSKLNASNAIEETSNNALPVEKVNYSPIIPEVVSKSDESLTENQSINNLGTDKTLNNSLQVLTDSFRITIPAENTEVVQNIIQCEPMDISINDSLSRYFPNLMNQTVVMGENISLYETEQNLSTPNAEHLGLPKSEAEDPKSEHSLKIDPIIMVSDNIKKEVPAKELENTESMADLKADCMIGVTSNKEKIEHLEPLKTKLNNIESESVLEVNIMKPASPNEVNSGFEIVKTISYLNVESIKLSSLDECPMIKKENENIDTNLFSDNEKQPIVPDCIQVENLTVNLNKCDDKFSEDDNLPPTIFTNTPSEIQERDEINVDEEIIESANNSPYVSLISGAETVPVKTEDTFEEIEIPFVTKTNVASSPPIVSKGYNFNFDDVDDPFATKTKIRLSPPQDTPTKAIENQKYWEFKVPNKGDGNRRKSQPADRKKLLLNKKINNSFDAISMSSKQHTNKSHDTMMMGNNRTESDIAINIETPERKPGAAITTHEIVRPLDAPPIVHDTFANNEDRNEIKEQGPSIEIFAHTSENNLQASIENKSIDQQSIASIPTVLSEIKAISSSESTYYSAGTSSTDSVRSKNVFNLPEIDDVNFNPFATKSKIRQSPPPNDDNDAPFDIRIMQNPLHVPLTKVNTLELNRTTTFDDTKLTKNFDNEDKVETELLEKDTSAKTTDTTSSSKTSDNQSMTREVNTEDEDTIEGPFLDPSEDIEKFSDFAVDDDNNMLQFNELRETPRETEDNLDGEMFIDAEAFEFLLNQNKTNVVADSSKESLFLKFDPLFAKRISSDGVLAARNIAQKKQSTPTKPCRSSLRNEASPIAGPSTLNITYEGDNNVSQESIEDVNITVTKPTMVVTPAFNPAVTPRNKSITPIVSNRRSITFTSPAIAVIDRLLSMSANNSILNQDTTITHSNGEQTEADLALTQLRDLLAEKEISVYNLRCESKELKDRLATMETQIKNLEHEGETRLNKINELTQRIAEKTKTNKNMAAVVEEYERTIATLIADIEHDKKRNAEERIRLINDRDEQTAHLTSMEVSFSDLHSKYEKSKQVILTCKANEDIYKKSLKDFEEQVTKMQANYEMLKQHATAKLNHANQEMEKMNKAHEAEVVKLNAMIKRNQLQASSLQESLAQKTKENDELTAICDELINSRLN